MKNVNEMTLKEMAAELNVARVSDKANGIRRIEAKRAAETPVTVKRTAAEGIRDSWKNIEVATKRTTRHNVICNGEEYRSVWQVLENYGVSSNKAIKFRGELKQEGSKSFILPNGQVLNFTLASQY